MNPFSKALIRRALAAVQRRQSAQATKFETGGFIRSGVGVPYADIQYHFLPAGRELRRHVARQRNMHFRHTSDRCARRAAAGCVWHLRMRRNPPRILFNYMSRDEDWTQMRACVRLTREIFAQQAFDRYRGRELQTRRRRQVPMSRSTAFVRERVADGLSSLMHVQDGGARRIRWRSSMPKPACAA